MARYHVIVLADSGFDGFALKLGRKTVKRCYGWIVAREDRVGQTAALLGLVKKVRRTFHARLLDGRERIASLSQRMPKKGRRSATVHPGDPQGKTVVGCIAGLQQKSSGKTGSRFHSAVGFQMGTTVYAIDDRRARPSCRNRVRH